jgi:hypothetical protein
MAPGWRQIYFGGTPRPDNNQGEDSGDTKQSTDSCHQLPLISPKTVNSPMPSPIQDPFSGISYSDMLRSSGMLYTDVETPEYSMPDSWPDLDWTAMEDVDPRQRSPQSHITSSPMNTMSASGFWSKCPSSPQGLNQNVSSTHPISKGFLQPRLGQNTDIFTQSPDASKSPSVVQSSFLPGPSGSHHMQSQNFAVPGHAQVQNSNNSPIQSQF